MFFYDYAEWAVRERLEFGSFCWRFFCHCRHSSHQRERQCRHDDHQHPYMSHVFSRCACGLRLIDLGPRTRRLLESVMCGSAPSAAPLPLRYALVIGAGTSWPPRRGTLVVSGRDARRSAEADRRPSRGSAPPGQAATPADLLRTLIRPAVRMAVRASVRRLELDCRTQKSGWTLKRRRGRSSDGVRVPASLTVRSSPYDCLWAFDEALLADCPRRCGQLGRPRKARDLQADLAPAS